MFRWLWRSRRAVSDSAKPANATADPSLPVDFPIARSSPTTYLGKAPATAGVTSASVATGEPCELKSAPLAARAPLAPLAPLAPAAPLAVLAHLSFQLDPLAALTPAPNLRSADPLGMPRAPMTTALAPIAALSPFSPKPAPAATGA